MQEINLNSDPSETELARKAVCDEQLHDLASSLDKNYSKHNTDTFQIVIGCMRLRGAAPGGWYTVVGLYEDQGEGKDALWKFDAYPKDLEGRTVARICPLPAHINFLDALGLQDSKAQEEVEVRLLGRFAYNYTLTEYDIFMTHYTRRVKTGADAPLPADPCKWPNHRHIETRRVKAPDTTANPAAFASQHINVIASPEHDDTSDEENEDLQIKSEYDMH